MPKADIGAMLNRFSPAVWADTEVVPYAARVSVWGRWFILLVAVFQFLYRPTFWYPDHVEYTLLPAAALALNGLVHYRLLTDRPVTWRWLLFLSVMDFALITAGLVFQAGLTSGLVLQSAIHGFMFLAYYPALALLIVVFASLWFGLAWTTVTAVVYSLLCMTTGPGLNLDLEQEKLLLARVAMMYALVLFVSLSDDGVGLPDGYGERGSGFKGMNDDAERIGGSLVVGSGRHGVGTTITCVVPYKADRRGG